MFRCGPGAIRKIFSTFFQIGIDKSLSVWYNISVRKRKSEVVKMNWFEFNLNGFLMVFIVLNLINVVIQTVKSIATVSWGKWGASITNAVAYGLYTVVVVYMNADGLGLFWKALIIGVANLIGVYVVKLVEEKRRKDRLWKIEATFEHKENFIRNLKVWASINHISVNYIDIGKYYVVNFYAPTQSDSKVIKEFVIKFNGKYFVSESKAL